MISEVFLPIMAAASFFVLAKYCSGGGLSVASSGEFFLRGSWLSKVPSFLCLGWKYRCCASALKLSLRSDLFSSGRPGPGLGRLPAP